MTDETDETDSEYRTDPIAEAVGLPGNHREPVQRDLLDSLRDVLKSTRTREDWTRRRVKREGPHGVDTVKESVAAPSIPDPADAKLIAYLDLPLDLGWPTDVSVHKCAVDSMKTDGSHTYTSRWVVEWPDLHLFDCAHTHVRRSYTRVDWDRTDRLRCASKPCGRSIDSW